jgi:hypothetical protein
MYVWTQLVLAACFSLLSCCIACIFPGNSMHFCHADWAFVCMYKYKHIYVQIALCSVLILFHCPPNMEAVSCPAHGLTIRDIHTGCMYTHSYMHTRRWFAAHSWLKLLDSLTTCFSPVRAESCWWDNKRAQTSVRLSYDGRIVQCFWFHTHDVLLWGECSIGILRVE